ncbi:cysteine proteinase [Clathrospora elynae]|uniref:Cysteine proteinase n=1 Tax=Clathrospora elynae TaxID=706981 RepID=A0A6A5SLH2_9PLEO|nr:cysteine proteinase [Clathrospora elynae]
MADAPPQTESLEILQSRHRKEHRELISRITSKKKQATKKTRKGVNDECERLERELKERQERELGVLNGHVEEVAEDVLSSDGEVDIAQATAKLSVHFAEGSNGGEDDTGGQVGGYTVEGARKKKPNRAKARLARRAAEQASLIASAEREAANAPNPRELERERMVTQLHVHKLSLQEIRADGHCLYAAVADQLQTRELGLAPKIAVTVIGNGRGEDEQGKEDYKKVRYAAADWIQHHADDFAGFMEDPLPEHVRKIRETGEWGGHVELLALARTYGVRICVLHSDGQVDRIEPEDAKELEEIWLGYYKYSHGLGEHYNSLRKVG